MVTVLHNLQSSGYCILIYIFSLQTVWTKLMPRGYLGMLSLRMEKMPNSLIPWKITIQMLLGGAFIMGVLFKECERKLRLCRSKPFSKSKIFSAMCMLIVIQMIINLLRWV